MIKPISNICRYSLILLLVIGCQNHEQQEEKQRFSDQIRDLDTVQGYAINPYTGDSIHPIANIHGDTLISGRKIPFNGQQIHKDSLPAPTIIPALAPTIIDYQENISLNEEDTYLFTFEKDSIEVRNSNEEGVEFHLTNQFGDTLPSNTPLPVSFKEKSCVVSEPVKAGTPRFKANSKYDIKHMDVTEGLMSSYVFDQCFDRSGHLWTVTNDGGVIKYDGTFFTTIGTHYAGMAVNQVTDIFLSSKNEWWILTAGDGTYRYDGQKFYQYGLDGNFPFQLNQVTEDQDGNLWFGGNGYIIKYDGESVRYFGPNEGLKQGRYSCILADSQGNIWTGGNIGLVKFDGTDFHYFTKEQGLSANGVRYILEDQNQTIWVGTNKGVNQIREKAVFGFTESSILAGKAILSIEQDREGGFWFGAANGAYYYDGTSVLHLSEKVGFTDHQVRSISEDPNGNIWFGSFGEGMYVYDPKSFKSINRDEGLETSSLYGLFEDSKNNLWLGYNNGTLTRFDGDRIYDYSNSLPNVKRNVGTMTEDQKGNIWFYTSGDGLYKFDGQSFHLINGIPKDGRTAFCAANGDLWFGSTQNLLKFDGTHWTIYKSEDKILIQRVLGIAEDSKGTIWATSANLGISKISGDSITHYSEKEGLMQNKNWPILVDQKDRVWFGSGAGVTSFDGERFQHFDQSNGLSQNYIWSITEDREGNVWVGSDLGLNKITFNDSANSSESNYSIVTYSSHDGIKRNDFNLNAMLVDHKNRLWAATGSHLNSLDLSYDQEEIVPTIHLTNLYIQGEYLDYQRLNQKELDITYDSVKPFINYPLHLQLPHDKNQLTFHFAGIDWSGPEHLEYSYRIAELDKKWSPVSPEPKADYKNLPYGTFTFEAKAIGSAGKWSEVVTYQFTIRPPWWHTLWARIIYVLIGILLIYGLIKWRTRKLQMRQKELEEEIEKATTEVKSQKEIVEQAHKEITDSIQYAERIQRSFLATEEMLTKQLQSHFVFFRPKEAVSGDFYWAGDLANGEFAIVNADSTGHGVPGAIMSILNISAIETAVKEKLTKPADIFNSTRSTIIERLKKDGSPDGGKDGMDASMISFNAAHSRMSYVAAQNPIWLVREGQLIEIKGEKMPVGKHDNDHVSFIGGEMELQKGDMIYTLTDGFQDQFGGDKGKKFKVRPLKELLVSNAHLSLGEQHELLSFTFREWIGQLEQVDDVCVIGIRV